MKRRTPVLVLGLMLAVAMVLFTPAVALAANSGWKSANGYNDNKHVGTPGNAYVEDGEHADFDSILDRVDYTFGNNLVPSTAIIEGIRVRLRARDSWMGERSFKVTLLDSGTARGTKNVGDIEDDYATYTLGGNSNTWGYGGWTADKINNHLEVRVASTVGTPLSHAYLDHIEIRVYYSLPGTTTTVTSSDSSSIYGQSVTFTATVSPGAATGTVEFLANGSSIGSASVTGGTASITTSTLDVGNYTIKAKYSGSSLYQGSEGTCSQTVGKAPLTITANDETVTYGDAAPAYSASYSGFVNGEGPGALSSLPSFACSYAAGSPVSGSPYTITPSGASADNYAITYANGALTVNKAALTITANDETVTYGDAAPAYSASYSGFVNGEGPGVLSGTLNFACSYAAGSPVSGSPYAITPSGASADNYNITFVDGALTVNKKDATIDVDDVSKTYGDADPALSATVTGTVNGETLDYSLSRAPGENVGSYSILITLGTDPVNDNYNITTYGGHLTINKKDATIDVDDKTKIYGDADPVLSATVTGTVNSETLDYTLSRTAGEDVGTYTITAILGTDPVNLNYDITILDDDLTITKRDATIDVDAKTKTYGDADPVLTATVTNAAAGDTLDYTLSRTAGEDVGTYDIEATLGSGAVNGNYNITVINDILTITKRDATIDVDAKTKTYGDADPALSATVTNAAAGDTLDYTLSRDAGEDVGTYDIEATLGSGAVNGNYDITVINDILTIGKKAATITVEDHSKRIGNGDPTLTATVTGTVNDETLDYTLSRTAGESLGAYTITATLGSGAVNDNYDITVVDGTFTIVYIAVEPTATVAPTPTPTITPTVTPTPTTTLIDDPDVPASGDDGSGLPGWVLALFIGIGLLALLFLLLLLRRRREEDETA